MAWWACRAAAKLRARCWRLGSGAPTYLLSDTSSVSERASERPFAGDVSCMRVFVCAHVPHVHTSRARCRAAAVGHAHGHDAMLLLLLELCR